MNKILSIIGTRPQFIKLYPICRTIEDFNKGASRINHVIINTGQHFDRLMSDVFISELKINKPSYNLGVKENTQCKQIGKMILKIEEVLLKETLSVGRVLSNDIVGRGWVMLSNYAGIVYGVTNIFLNILLIQRYGITGAAWVSTISYGFALSTMLIIFRRLFNNSWTKVLLPQRGDWAL